MITGFISLFSSQAIMFMILKSKKKIPVLWSLIGAIYLSVNGYFNTHTDKITCGLQAHPLGCVNDENIPCERGENVKKVKLVLLVIPLLFVFLLITVTMTLIFLTVKKQERKMKKYTFEIQQKEPHKENCHIVRNSTVSSHPELSEKESKFDEEESGQNQITMLQRTKKSVSRSVYSSLSTQSKKTRAVFVQSMLYVFAFVFTWIFQLLQIVTTTGGRPSFKLLVGAKICNPAQGLINILVYTRQSIISLRKVYPDYSWWKAFVTVVKSGGDNDGNLSKEKLQRRFSRS